MNGRKPATIGLTVLAYMASTFGVQGASHFGLNASYYGSLPIMRTEPIVPMGLTAMIIQGLIFAWLFPWFNRGPHPIRNGVVFSSGIGAFLASYIMLGEAGKYAIPSIASWMIVEGSTAAVQFLVFGVLLGLVHRRGEALRPAYEGA